MTGRRTLPRRGGGALMASAAAALAAVFPALAAERLIDTERGRVLVAELTDRLVRPWAIDLLPDGRMIVTEKPGRLRIVDGAGAVSPPVLGLPRVAPAGQGGLLDVTLHPDFAENRLVYLSYTEPAPGGASSTAVARAALGAGDGALEGLAVVFRQLPRLPGRLHYGSRVVFARDGLMFVTLGERSRRSYRVQAQDLGSHLGKIVRLRPDGGVPPGNPFVGRAGARPEIWSYGHRNVQGAAVHPVTGRLWAVEHGPRGGDELNIVEPGRNYGWPVVSHGVEYSGLPVGDGRRSAPGMEDPVAVWTPVIAPGGMAFYTGGAFPGWRGDLLVSGLRSRALVRLELDGETVRHEERLLEGEGRRIRDVAVGRDGLVYVVTDERRGRILRLSPAP